MSQSAQKKMGDHLWYLRKRLELFSLFSHRTCDACKRQSAKKILKWKAKPSNQKQTMPLCESFRNTKLKDLVGLDSWTMLERYVCKEPTFLEKPVNDGILIQIIVE